MKYKVGDRVITDRIHINLDNGQTIDCEVITISEVLQGQWYGDYHSISPSGVYIIWFDSEIKGHARVRNTKTSRRMHPDWEEHGKWLHYPDS